MSRLRRFRATAPIYVGQTVQEARAALDVAERAMLTDFDTWRSTAPWPTILAVKLDTKLHTVAEHGPHWTSMLVLYVGGAT